MNGRARSFRFPLTVAGIFAAVFALQVAFFSSAPGAPLTVPAIVAAYASGMCALWWWLRSRIGGLTAVAAVCLGSAALLAVPAALLPVCSDPVSLAASRCSATEVLAWSGSGALTPLAAALLVAPAYWGFRSVRAAVRKWKER